jgi:tetratricopeptide (TPR) repeat protein
MPVWRRQIPALVFGIVVAVALAGLLGPVLAIKSREPEIPTVDTAAESRRAREKLLREQGNTLIRQGRLVDARERFAQLQKLAPRSPYVSATMERLNAILQRQAATQQQLAQSQAKFNEGMLLFNDKKYEEAAQRFQEAFSLNPDSAEAVEYLKLAQQEQQKLRSPSQPGRVQPPVRRASQTGGSTAASSSGEASTPASQSEPARLNTVFAHNFTDGRIVVRAGADIVANELLYEERPARLFRRASRAPKPVNVTNQFPAKNADVQIWVTIPSSNIQEHHVLQAIRFSPGTTQQLVVRYDEGSRQFSYVLK